MQRVRASMSEKYTIGVDYGTLSGRAVVVRTSDGAELGSAVHEYSNAVMDQKLNHSGVALPPDLIAFSQSSKENRTEADYF